MFYFFFFFCKQSFHFLKRKFNQNKIFFVRIYTITYKTYECNFETCNCAHDMLELLDILTIFSLATTEAERDYSK